MNTVRQNAVRGNHISPFSGRVFFHSMILLSVAAVNTWAGAMAVGQQQAWQQRMQGRPVPPAAFTLAPAFPKLSFNKPTCLIELPGGRMLVTEIGGKILSFAKDKNASSAETLLNLADGHDEQAASQVSIFSATPDPGFAENRWLYVCYTHPEGGRHTRVSRFTLGPKSSVNSERVILRWPAGGHNAGCLKFDRQGYLYISTGDGWGPNPPDHLKMAQDVSDLRGSILRIDVRRGTADEPYVVPRDNPFVKSEDARPEIWAYGLRNPWKFAVGDAGELWVADNGWESWEMIHRVRAGSNCGWPIMEGRVLLRTEVKQGPTPIIPPVKDHPHTEANSVIGGMVYQGGRLPQLNGTFIYGDYITGTIWGLRADGDQYHHTTLLDTDQRIVAFEQGSQGEAYVVDYDLTGQIYELIPSTEKDRSETFPRRLSETGLFRDLSTLQPAAGVTAYDVGVQPWMDGASARRWIAVPKGLSVGLAGTSKAGSAATFPEGTVLIKHLQLPGNFQKGSAKAVRLETQLLHYELGSWRPYSYLWNEDGTDATLVSSIGTDHPVKTAGVERTWHVGAENECRLCHNAGSHYVLGFNLSQLASSPSESGSSQLARLSAAGVVTSAPADTGEILKLADPHDTALGLDERARSYLHVNCSMCHHPGGNAIVSFYLRKDMPLTKLNTDKTTGIGTFGMQDARLIVPGDPYRSVLFYRMSKLGYARMPYIGSQVVDSRGIALIGSWIRSLPAKTARQLSPPLQAVTDEHRALGQLKENKPIGKTAIPLLLNTTEGSLALAEQIHAGMVKGSAAEQAIALGSAKPGDVSGLFETFLPESKRRARLGANFEPQIVLGKSGNAERGRLIFFSDNARCRTCHDIQDPAKSFGPTLREVVKKYPRRSEMLQHIVKPSLKIDEKYTGYVAVTDSGRIVQGISQKMTKQLIVLQTPERKTVTLNRAALESLQKSPVSLMPQQILSDLTAQEAADLLAYILSLPPS